MSDPKLEGSATMNTEGFAFTQLATDDIVDEMEIGVVHGPAGIGKTYAVQHAMGRQQLPVVYLQADKRTTPKGITREVLAAVTGFDQDAPRYELREQLMNVLAETPRLVVIDEAQSLGYQGIEHLRYLHDDRRTTFALMLVGGPDCWRILSRYPQLRSRVYRREEMRPLTEQELLMIIPQYHPVWADVEPELILLADEFARGHFREWRNLTKTAVRTLEREDTEILTEDLIVHCTRLLGGVRDAA